MLGSIKACQEFWILDWFSRFVVGWMVARRESDSLAERLISETCVKQGIPSGQLTLHADRGSSMTSRAIAFLLADLGVTKTYSRPHVSNDNPYSESQFKTIKYRPEFPQRFGSIEDACAFCGVFFPWYNSEHRHSGIAMLTPEMVHSGQSQPVLDRREEVLSAAYVADPERFIGHRPYPTALPDAVWINKAQVAQPYQSLSAHSTCSAVASPRVPDDTSGPRQIPVMP